MISLILKLFRYVADPQNSKVFIFPDGSQYRGDTSLVDGVLMRQGGGTFTDAEGNVYSGEWRADSLHGSGSAKLVSCCEELLCEQQKHSFAYCSDVTTLFMPFLFRSPLGKVIYANGSAFEVTSKEIDAN